jgi:hypothetical protein
MGIEQGENDVPWGKMKEDILIDIKVEGTGNITIV